MKSRAGNRASAPTKRRYEMSARAAATEDTAKSILEAAVQLWAEQPIEKMTLQDIAHKAGVTVQTVLRHFGSKDGVVEAAITSDAGAIVEQRAEAAVGDVAGAVNVLIAHYERWGDAVIRTLAATDRYRAARRITEHGRQGHREWCERYLHPDADELTLDALVVATDVYVWKVLRRDLGRSKDEVKHTIERLVRAVLASY